MVTNCHTISSSLLDFVGSSAWSHGCLGAWNSRNAEVLRAAFVLHKELVSAKQARPKDGRIQQKMVVYPTEFDEI